MNIHQKNAMILKAFCDDKRLAILEILRNGEKCACRLLDHLEITQSTLSHHMKILCGSGVISSRKEGKWTYYAINKDGADTAIGILKEITTITSDKRDQC